MSAPLSSTYILRELEALADKEIAGHSARFFKSGPGGYAEGDKFLGIRVPKQREIAKKFRDIPLKEAAILLQSPFHEVRLTALFILVYKYQKAKLPQEKETIYQFYMNHTGRVNNWDLVDSSARYIAGHFLYEFKKDRSVLYQLSDSENLWKRRIAMMATFYFIDQHDVETTLELAEKYLNDPEDLIHKATGWMLREIGKRKKNKLIHFLNLHYQNMPRTMLRYAIEKLDEPLRKKYLTGRI